MKLVIKKFFRSFFNLEIIRTQHFANLNKDLENNRIELLDSQNTCTSLNEDLKNNRIELLEFSHLGTSFIYDDFQKYMDKFIEASVNNIKSNTDLLSCDVIDSLIKKLKFFYGYYVSNSTPISVSKLLCNLSTETEQHFLANPKLIKENAEYLKIKKKYNLSELFEVGFYHSGLKFVPTCVSSIVDKIVLDCGAFDGESSLVFSEYNPKLVYAFEPVANTFKKLQEIIVLNNKSNIITPIKKGIGDASKKLEIINNWEVGNTTNKDIVARASDAEKETIDIISIDEFMNNKSDIVGVIKFDIEGNEYEGIIGAIDTIKKDRPILLISVYHTIKDLFEIKPYLESLDLGYKFMFRHLVPTPRNFLTDHTGRSFDDYTMTITEYMLIAYIDEV